MRALLLAGAIVFALGSYASAQTVTGSAASGTGTASQASTAASLGNGAAMSGGIESSQVAAFDISGAIHGPVGQVVGTGGATNVQSAGVTASTSTGSAAAAALGAATGTGTFAGFAVRAHP